MKYVVVLGDGMADEPVEELGWRTPLAFADTPALDALSRKSEIGMLRTIPEGMNPGSDTANLSVLGYDPRKYYTGRAPLEALSIGVPMKSGDIALRCNLVTLSGEEGPFETLTMADHSSGEISGEDSTVLLEAVKEAMQTEEFRFYAGTGYRHCLIWSGGSAVPLTPPHDILGKEIGPYLPGENVLGQMMRRSHEILKDHPVNQRRRSRGLQPANCCWFWGAGTKPALPSFREKTGKKGIMISAVDLLKGIAIGSGMDVAAVEGATGGLDTNYEGKTEAAVKALTEDGYDFAYIHIEAPDEMGHQGSAQRKAKAVSYIDKRVIGPLISRLDALRTEYRLLVLPDHPTPVGIRTHTADPVPYLLYDSAAPGCRGWDYHEQSCRDSGIERNEGYEMMDYFLKLI